MSSEALAITTCSLALPRPKGRQFRLAGRTGPETASSKTAFSSSPEGPPVHEANNFEKNVNADANALSDSSQSRKAAFLAGATPLCDCRTR